MTRDDIVKSVFRGLVKTQLDKRYAVNAFAKASCPMHHDLQYPQAPGDGAYRKLNIGTSAMLMGAVNIPSFEEKVDVPQLLINANIKSFSEGLKLVYPDDAVRQYFQETFKDRSLEECIVYRDKPVGDRLRYSILHTFPRIGSCQPAVNGGLQSILEKDLRQAATFDENVLEKRRDRRNLTDKDLLRTYEFIQDHPEHFLGFTLWQDTILHYTNDMDDLFVEHSLKQGLPRHAEGHYHQEHMVDAYPLFHTVKFTRASIETQIVPLFFIAAALEHAGPGKIPTDKDYIAGITKAQHAGIFRRTFESPFGQRTVVCPFSAACVRWLKMDMGNCHDPSDSLIATCIRKIHEDRRNNKHLKGLVKGVRDGISDILNASDPERISEIEQRIQTSGKCPFGYDAQPKP